MNTSALPELLTLPEAAALLRIGRSTAYELARSNQLPGCRRVGGVYRVSRRVLIQFIETGGTPGATPAPERPQRRRGGQRARARRDVASSQGAKRPHSPE